MTTMRNIIDSGKTIVIGAHAEHMHGYYASAYRFSPNGGSWASSGHGDSPLLALGDLMAVQGGKKPRKSNDFLKPGYEDHAC